MEETMICLGGQKNLFGMIQFIRTTSEAIITSIKEITRGINKTWGTNNFDMYRYRRNLSFPAFSNCSIDNNAGNGDGANGDLVGTINGYLDWSSTITDDSSNWTVKFTWWTGIKSTTWLLLPRLLAWSISHRGVCSILNHPQDPLCNGQWCIQDSKFNPVQLAYNGGLITIRVCRFLKTR